MSRTIESHFVAARGGMSMTPAAALLDGPWAGWSNPRALGDCPTRVPGGKVRGVRELPIGVREGEVLAGKYRIGRVLGGGAMGTVVVAHHLWLDQKVAIKFLLPAAGGHPDSVARFIREAQATVRLTSEHVVRVLDVAALDVGAPYIVMEYLDGCDLAVWLAKHRMLPIAGAVDFILQACDAVAEAHEIGIIHRDLKPANLFAVERGDAERVIKVLDFGISKTDGLVPSTISPHEFTPRSVVTGDQETIGSLYYMSPEQMESARDVDARTDIWALGVTLCELVTGRLPFEGTSIVHVYSKIASGFRPRLRETSPHVPVALEEVLLKCLERDRDRRYGSARELAAALVAFGSRQAAGYAERIARRSKRSEAPAPAGTDLAPPRSARPRAPVGIGDTLPSAVPTAKHRGRVLLYAGGALGIALLLGVGAMWIASGADAHRGGPTAPPSGAAPMVSAAGPERAGQAAHLEQAAVEREVETVSAVREGEPGPRRPVSTPASPPAKPSTSGLIPSAVRVGTAAPQERTPLEAGPRGVPALPPGPLPSATSPVEGGPLPEPQTPPGTSVPAAKSVEEFLRSRK